MTTALAPRQTSLLRLERLTQDLEKKLPPAIIKLIDIGQTATSRATFYNTKEEQNKAVEEIHKALYDLDRGIYSLCLLLPGMLDFAKQQGLGLLLGNPHSGETLIAPELESRIMARLATAMPPHRLLKFYEQLRRNRVNNSKTKRMILRSLLSSKSLELWSIKYRYKMRRALEHAWDKRTTGILRSILGKRYGKTLTRWTGKEDRIIREKIIKHVPAGMDLDVLECVAFILGHEDRLGLPLLKAYHEGRKNFEAAKNKGIPLDNLMYLRARFHKEMPKADVYTAAKDSMTEAQKLQRSRATKKEGVEISFDPFKQDAVKLYVYLYEMAEAMTEDERKKVDIALKKKAKEASQKLLAKHESVGIVMDVSQSMRGDDTQKLRPIAVSLACKDMLEASAKKSYREYVGGFEKNGLHIPCGSTALSEALVKVLKKGPEAVYVFSDGYENTPAGRFDEVVRRVREMGIQTPIYQISTVMAAESGGVRNLSEKVPSMPLNKPESLASAMLKNVLLSNPKQGLLGLANTVAGQLRLRGPLETKQLEDKKND